MLIFIVALIVVLIAYIIFLWYEKIQLTVENTRLKMEQEFVQNDLKNFSNQAMVETQKHFLNMAENSFKYFYEQNKTHMDNKEKDIFKMLDPISKTLSTLQTQIYTLEKDRIQTSEKLLTQLLEIQNVQKALHFETSHMRKTFNNPGLRGRWGEIQLRRIVELTGMLEYCDFVEQSSSMGVRPDMIIRLPENKTIIIDAKAPMKAYMETLESINDVDRDLKVKEHAKNVRSHIKGLSQKSYWSHLDMTPEFVVLFLPTDAFFSHAFEGDHMLFEYGINEKVIMATPSTLIALLKTIFFAWQNYRISDHAKTVCEVGKLLFEKHKDFREHFEKVGKMLEGTLTQYQKTEEHFDKNILPQERKLKAIMGG